MSSPLPQPFGPCADCGEWLPLFKDAKREDLRCEACDDFWQQMGKARLGEEVKP